MSVLSRPLIGITLGDPAGVGPEVTVKALSEEYVREWCRPVVLGDMGVVQDAVHRSGLDLPVEPVDRALESASAPGVIPVLPESNLSEEDRVPGTPTPAGAHAAARYIETGAGMALDGRIQALVTAPISKEQLQLAGRPFPGHTDLLAHVAGGVKVVMMLAGPTLRVVLVTIHVAYRDVPGLLTVEKIVETARITNDSLKRFFGIPHPRLAAAGLNPHAGEGGLFGNEESTTILPAVEQARQEGIDLTGPYPPDTLFFRAANGEFDAVVCMYHDQGLIPLKLLHFKDGVNITLGLPFIRVSVDHGTAFDIAGKGLADHTSMLAAIKTASEMAGKTI